MNLLGNIEAEIAVKLRFLSSTSSLHWHENLLHQQQDATTWPPSVSLKFVEAMLVLMLSGKVLRLQSVVNIRVLDHIMDFKFDDITQGGALVDNDYQLHVTSKVSFQIIIEESISNNEVVDPALICKSCELTFFEKPYQRLLSMCDSYIGLSDRWHGPNTAILTGVDGSGKSHILSNIRSTLSSRDDDMLMISISVSNYRDSRSQLNPLSSYESEQSRFIWILREVIDSFQAHTNRHKWQEHLEEGIFHPIIMIIDDMDAIFQKYIDSLDVSSDNHEAISRQAWLLHEITMFARSMKMIIIGATRLPMNRLPTSNAAYPVFEIGIDIPTPSYQDRKLVIESMIVSTYPSDVMLELIDADIDAGNIDDERSTLATWCARLSGLTAGYHIGDLHTIILRALNHYRGDSTRQQSPASSTTNRDFVWKYMLRALAMTPPKQLQKLSNANSFASISSYAVNDRVLSWKDFCGYDEVKVKLQKLLQRFRTNQSNDQGIVLYGASGSGKSYLASIIASEAHMNYVSIQSTEILSKYYSESEARIRSLFTSARAASPCVLFFDEFDAIACKRSVSDSSAGVHSLNSRILSTFLNELDGIAAPSMNNSSSSSNQVLVVVSCQDITRLDDALVRTGRLQHHIELALPSRSDLEAMLRHRLRFKEDDDTSSMSCSEPDTRIPCDANVTLAAIIALVSSRTTKPTGATVIGLCNTAISAAIREHIRENNISNITPNLAWRHFQPYTGIS